MRKSLAVILLSFCSVVGQADSATSDWSEAPKYTEPRVQGIVAIGWRFDHEELGHVPVMDFGALVKVARPLFLQTRVSMQPEQTSFFVTNLAIGSIAIGPRIQTVSRRFGAFGSAEIDYSWYFGRTALYSADSNKIVSRVSTRSFKTGLALTGGFCFRVASWLAIDFGVRKVFNSARSYVIVESPIPPGGLYFWPFPHDTYNQATIFLQARIL